MNAVTAVTSITELSNTESCLQEEYITHLEVYLSFYSQFYFITPLPTNAVIQLTTHHGSVCTPRAIWSGPGIRPTAVLTHRKVWLPHQVQAPGSDIASCFLQRAIIMINVLTDKSTELL